MKNKPKNTSPRKELRSFLPLSLARRGARGEVKKSLGQNFLRDQKILKKIADFAQIEKGDIVLEVGPGEGSLTKILLEKAAKVIAVEKDERLAERLTEKFASAIASGKLEVVEEDILNYKLRIMNYALVGNIPYYITGAIFKKFLESYNPPRSICFVVQKEVAERIMARDGKESILSISIKIFGKPEFGGVIKAGSFYPRPKVSSAIIGVRNIGIERFTDLKIENFFNILKAGFAHKRKLLINNLSKTVFDTFGVSKTKEIFKKCEISEKARAEDLGVDDWLCLATKLLQ